MDVDLTFFEAQLLRDAGVRLTQVTTDATSLHATEVYRMDAEDADCLLIILDRMTPAEVARCNRLLSMV